jgi:hypothetical protein
MTRHVFALALLVLGAHVSPVTADDFENAQMVALSVDPLRCHALGGTHNCYSVSGLHEGVFIDGSQVDDIHHQLRLLVPNGRQSDAKAFADSACAAAADGTLSWDSSWVVQVIVNEEIAAQCEITKRRASQSSPKERPASQQRDTSSAAKLQPDDASFDALLKNLAKRDQARPDIR